jgi:hypothetical protein
MLPETLLKDYVSGVLEGRNPGQFGEMRIKERKHF